MPNFIIRKATQYPTGSLVTAVNEHTYGILMTNQKSAEKTYPTLSKLLLLVMYVHPLNINCCKWYALCIMLLACKYQDEFSIKQLVEPCNPACHTPFWLSASRNVFLLPCQASNNWQLLIGALGSTHTSSKLPGIIKNRVLLCSGIFAEITGMFRTQKCFCKYSWLTRAWCAHRILSLQGSLWNIKQLFLAQKFVIPRVYTNVLQWVFNSLMVSTPTIWTLWCRHSE